MELDTLTIKKLFGEVVEFVDMSENILVIIGAFYASKVVLKLLYRINSCIWTYIIPRLWHSKDFPKVYKGKWAVITGASEGIGRSYAIKLAGRKMNVVLISRSMEKLQLVADEIRSKHGESVETICFPLDMCKLRDDAIYGKLKKQLDELDVGILVNNVGFFFERLQYFLTVPKETHQKVVDLNISTVVAMTQMVLPQMIERRRGAIINIGSGASVKPTPLMSSYSAAKTFVDDFSRVVQREYADKGLTVQCIQPFYVSTNMTHQAKPNFFVVHPDTYVEGAITTLGYSNRNYGYWTHGIFGLVGELLPEWLYTFFAINFNSHLWSWLTGVSVELKKKQ